MKTSKDEKRFFSYNFTNVSNRKQASHAKHKMKLKPEKGKRGGKNK